MGQLVLKDNAASTLAVSLSATAGSGQTVTIAGAGAKFPTVTGTDWSYLTIFDGAGIIESMKVTAHAAGSASFTVTRGTAAGITGITDADVKAWSAGTSTGVACRLISQVVLDINGAATNAAASAGSAAANAGSAAADAATVTAHIADADAAHAASAISYAGSANLSATNVEAALDELDSEKQPIDAATAKTNIAQTFTAKQSFAKTVKLQEVLEKIAITASAPITAFDWLTQAIQYFTSNTTANWTINFRGDGTPTTLNSLMAVGESITATVLATQGTTGYLPTTIQVDGTTTGVTTKYLGGTAWTADASCINAFTFTIIKTADATFTVLASKSKYA